MDALEGNVARLARSLDELVQHRLEPPGDPIVGQSAPNTYETGLQDAAGDVDNCQARPTALWQTPPPSVPEGTLLNRGSQTAVDEALSLCDLGITPNGLPPRDAILDIADLYFTLVQPWCPLFADKAAFKTNMFSKYRDILLHGVVVAAIRFWEGGPEMQKARYLEHSRGQIVLQCVNKCTLVSTQALALLAVDALGRGTGPHCWNAMCMLVTAARHLGIATNPLLTTAESSTPLVRNDDEDTGEGGLFAAQVEEERRLFWVICSLDRFSSVAHGQPGGIDTRSIRMPYPSCGSQWTQSADIQWFNGHAQWQATIATDSANIWHQYIDLLAFADRCNQLLIQPVNLFIPAHSQDWQARFRALDAELSSWFDSLPHSVHEQRQSFDIMAMLLFANFQLIRIRLYTVAAFPSTTSPHVRASSSARTRCGEAVAEVASLARQLQPVHLDQLGPQFAFVLWVSARSLVILWTTGFDKDAESVPDDLTALMDGMWHLALRWPSAGRYKDLVQLIQDTKDEPDGAARMDIFNDTRRTAHGLERALGELSRNRNADVLPSSLDFLDLPSLDNDNSADPTLPWMSSFGLEADREWFT